MLPAREMPSLYALVRLLVVGTVLVGTDLYAPAVLRCTSAVWLCKMPSVCAVRTLLARCVFYEK